MPVCTLLFPLVIATALIGLVLFEVCGLFMNSSFDHAAHLAGLTWGLYYSHILV